MRTFLYALTLCVLVAHLNFFLNAAQAPAVVANLLFLPDPGNVDTAGGDGSITSAAIERALLQGDTELPGTVYGVILFGTIASVVLAAVAARTVASWRWRALAVAPFVIAAAAFVLVLPFDYGVLQRAKQAPRVVARLGQPTTEDGQLAGFLLQSGEAVVLLWDPAERRVLRLRADQVARLTILGYDNLFGAPASSAQSQTGEQRK